MQSLTRPQDSHTFTMSGLTALHWSTFGQGFSNNECQAAARGLLRHDAHIDGTHYHARTHGGLHPSYIAFHSNTQEPELGRSQAQKELVEATLQDVFDAIAMQDHLDGGISLLIRCAGSGVSPTMLPEKIPLELYITPRELQEHCAIKKVKSPQSFPATHINTDGPQYLPGPLVATGARIACSAQAPNTFEKKLKTSMAAGPKKPASAAISEGIQLAASVAKDMLSQSSHIRQCQPADIYVADRDPGPIFSVRSELARNGVNFSPPLISIGPNTDATLDQFKLGDKLLTKLCVLVGTVRSSRWESVFRSQQWDLTYKQASVLVMSLLADLQGVPFNPEIVKVRNFIVGAHLS
ncbi:hypothetical protein P692DRAFT_20750803 [Suillus brevipes Sb2]|nr:hypothetical protein P692DRAFT_20750803 [Suillus brevipes Sb2]